MTHQPGAVQCSPAYHICINIPENNRKIVLNKCTILSCLSNIFIGWGTVVGCGRVTTESQGHSQYNRIYEWHTTQEGTPSLLPSFSFPLPPSTQMPLVHFLNKGAGGGKKRCYQSAWHSHRHTQSHKKHTHPHVHIQVWERKHNRKIDLRVIVYPQNIVCQSLSKS